MPLELSVVHADDPVAAELVSDWRALSQISDCHWIDPELRWLVEAYSLDRYEHAVALAGEAAEATASKLTVRRVTLSGERGADRVVHIKLERPARWKDRWTNLARGHRPVGRLRHEFEMLRRLGREGILVATPIAYGRRDRKSGSAWLVAAEPQGSVPLTGYVATTGGFSPSDRMRLFTHLGRAIARLHNAGYCHGRLDASRVLIVPRGAEPEIALIDIDQCAAHRRISLTKRAQELAGLVATLSPSVVMRVEKSAVVDGYLRASGFETEQAEFHEQLATELDRLLDRQRTWQVREQTAPTLSASAQLETVEPHQMWLDGQHQSALERAGITTFASVLATQLGTNLRALDDRENWRLDLAGTRGTYRAYLKKHHVRDWKTRLRARMGWGPGDTAGRIEAQNIAGLTSVGIPTMRLIGFGEKLHEDGLCESFVLTEELAGFRQLDEFLRARFPVRDPASRNPVLDRLIRDVAKVARKFHRVGFNHRDLYCCHFFVRETEAGAFKIHLIDLQRVQYRRRLRRRWIVKDLAQLAYSAPRERIGCRERVSFLRAYFGVRKLLPEHKRLVRRVLFKQRWMERTLGLHP